MHASPAQTLGEAEMEFASDILCWLCHERVIGSIALRNALLALPRYRCDQASMVHSVVKKTQG